MGVDCFLRDIVREIPYGAGFSPRQVLYAIGVGLTSERTGRPLRADEIGGFELAEFLCVRDILSRCEDGNYCGNGNLVRTYKEIFGHV